jgi:hypothetical protein
MKKLAMSDSSIETTLAMFRSRGVLNPSPSISQNIKIKLRAAAAPPPIKNFITLGWNSFLSMLKYSQH